MLLYFNHIVDLRNVKFLIKVLNLHYHGDEEQDISGEEEGNVEEAEV